MISLFFPINLNLADLSHAKLPAPPALAAPRLAPAQDLSVFPSQLDLTAPKSAALYILGISASKASHPTNLQELVAFPIAAIDASGHLKQGFAVDTQIMKLGRFSAVNFFKDNTQRIFRETNLSFAGVLG